MKQHFTSKVGEHSISLVATPKIAGDMRVANEQIVSSQNLKIQDLTGISSLHSFISKLKETERALLALNHHPLDQAMVGVKNDSLSQLSLLLVRLPSKQARIDAQTLEEESQQEAEISRKLANSMRPLVAKIAKNEMTAEGAMVLINQQPNPGKARRVLLAHHAAPATILQGNNVILKNKDEFAQAGLKLKGSQPHHIQIRILSLDLSRSILQARLVSCDEPSDIFKVADLRHQALTLKVHDADNFFLMGQCAALGWNVSISATFDISLTQKQCTFAGSLLSLKNRTQLVAEVQKGIAERASTLLADPR